MDLLTRLGETGWLPFIAATGTYLAKRLIDTLMPPGYTLRWTHRFLHKLTNGKDHHE
jgi:hypothetical protein